MCSSSATNYYANKRRQAEQAEKIRQEEVYDYFRRFRASILAVYSFLFSKMCNTIKNGKRHNKTTTTYDLF